MYQATRFVFDRYELIPAENKIVFEYVMEYSDHPAERFRETLTFPGIKKTYWKRIPAKLLQRTLQTLHLACGVSYWKMSCPPILAVTHGGMTAEQMEWWKIVYTQGMGEFYYKNKIDFRDLIHFEYTEGKAVAPISINLKDRCLVPIGGGKDSMVTAQLLREHGFAFDAFTMGNSHIQTAAIEALGVSHVLVERQIDSLMVMRSKAGEVYNGHVPISLLYTFSALLTGMLTDYRTIVFSNEKSANIGNVIYHGLEVNHQWSKSLQCEEMVREYVHRYLTPDMDLFSLLRPLHEYEIVRRFVKYGNYFSTVSSCNRNFVVSSAQPKAFEGAYWCGRCPKCAFMFALFAAFLPKEEVIRMFGKNLFADEELLPLYQELLGMKGIKPFECVGLPEEVLAAFADAAVRHEWDEDALMKWFIDTVLPGPEVTDALKRELRAVGDLTTLPERFRACYDN